MLLTKIILIYFLLSMWEWILHCMVMHGDAKEFKRVPIIGNYLSQTAQHHLDHHKEVNMNMSLNNISDVNSLFFSWQIFMIITILMTVSLLLFNFKPKEASLISIGLGLLVCFLWNNWHTDMHGTDVKISPTQGFPNKPGFISRGPLYRWLWKYHATHHLQKGSKYNYNIIFPGFDWMVGTYKGNCVDNNDYCNKNWDYRCHIRKSFCLTNEEILPKKY